MKRDVTVFSLVLYFIIIPFLGNIIIAGWSMIVGPLFFTYEVNKMYVKILGGEYYFVNLILVFTVFIMLTIYRLLPVINKLKKCIEPHLLGDFEKKIILNTPIFISVLIFFGWFSGGFIGDFLVYGVYGYSPESKNLLLVIAGIYVLAGGSFGFVFYFYLLEYINRKLVIPIVFKNSNISDIKGAYFLNTRKRFFIMFFAIGVYPSSQLIIAVMRLRYNPSQNDALAIYNSSLITFIITIIIGLLITIFMGRMFKEPLEEMNNAAIKIGGGDYDVKLEVNSNDELGMLGETFNNMAKELKEKELIKDTFGKLVEPEIRDYLLNQNLNLGGELCNITILFSDIRGFTTISEKLSPGEVVQLLNRYFKKMGDCVRAEKGLVNKFIGDAILAIFGAPVPIDNHQERAIKAALRMREELEILNKESKNMNLPELQFGVGIHSGEVLAGNIGTENRMEYTVIGDNVNLASRIEGLCKNYKKDILISEDVFTSLSNSLNCKFLDEVIVKGKSNPIKIYYLD